MKIQIAVMVSGSGSNLQAIIDAARTDALNTAEVRVVVSNKHDAFALKRAEKEGIEALFLDPKTFPSRMDYYRAITLELKERKIDLICLAGFLLKLEGAILGEYKGRILNIHPSLLPKFGGKGLYGHFVHDAVIKSGEKESGCTVHVVDEVYDHGPSILQKKVPVLPSDTPESLAERVLQEEHILYPQAIRLFLKRRSTYHS